jgi:hypothetical protein
LEQEIKGIDFEIKEVRRTAAISPTLEEKLSHQKHQRELESKRSKLRRELFARQDEIESERNGLIEQLEAQLQQQVEEQTLFTIEWELVCGTLCAVAATSSGHDQTCSRAAGETTVPCVQRVRSAQDA